MLPLISSFLAGTTAACLCVPGIFRKFTHDNQLTVWQTREMAKVMSYLGLMTRTGELNVCERAFHALRRCMRVQSSDQLCGISLVIR